MPFTNISISFGVTFQPYFLEKFTPGISADLPR